MRCKNCGSENDDNLYICQNCGSPLYDEDDMDDTQQAVPVEDEPVRRSSDSRQTKKAKEEEKKKQQTIIIIAVLSVLLIAIIVGTIIAVAHSKKDDDALTESSSITSESTTEEDSAYFTTEKTTQTTTEKTTTTTTTTTTTKAPTFNVSLSSNEGGEVEGDGTYKRGEHITVIARPDDGYEFDGWYKGSTRVSENTKYTFTVKENTQLEAVFTYVGFPDEPVEGEDVDQ